ncbi:uncharacterized protein LOC131663419 [Phymastichus coffea]|uniref:uncharacterized protein LOC131663419 n=1 Tax=Phymastichus coffea TaxID=108790 RepID=UPI00273C030A|nr:uncharacterized protein LOC131663419 [Phymastichus coffea]
MATTVAQNARINFITVKYQAFQKGVDHIAMYVTVEPDAINAKLRLTDLTVKRTELTELIDELINIDPKNEIINSFDNLNAQYYNTATIVTRLYNDVQQPRILPNPLANSTMTATNITWAFFKSQFTALVHNQTALSDDAKAHYLFTSVVGSARAKIDEYEMNAEDYLNAWQALLDFYDHKRIVATRHLNALLDLPRVRKDKDQKKEVTLSELYDSARQHINVLKRLNVNFGEDLVVRCIERCLPPYVYSRWNDKLDVNKLPLLDSLFKFIQRAIFKQEALEESNDYQSNPQKCSATSTPQRASKISKTSTSSFATTSSQSSTLSALTSRTSLVCPKCQGSHQLFKCDSFKSLEVQSRWDFAIMNKLCFNCLWTHKLPCSSTKTYKECGKRHHTLLHNTNTSKSNESQLMTTAIVQIKNNRGNLVMACALLDSCSTVNLITERFAKSLHLSEFSCSVNIGAVDDLCTVSKKYIQASIHSKCNNSIQQIQLLIVPKIAEAVPNDVFPREFFNIPKGVKLADPQFHLPKPIDILLSSSVTLSVLAVGQIKFQREDSKIILQKTTLGWIVAGGSIDQSSYSSTSCNIVKLDKLIERFWLIEDLDHEPNKSRDEIACEQQYVTHTKLDSSGRYIVRLPFRDSKFDLENSKAQALKRLESLKAKFARNPSLKAEYSKVMKEYLPLGHMTLCEDDQDGYFLPHHAVVKESSETTKVRVVFDASSKTSTCISLNDTLMVGPTIQNTIFEQVLRFRTHPFVITADIEKMYRQILVHPDDRKFQSILWYHQGEIRTFQLNTVIFGVAAAPFLTIRTIQQLARDKARDFPRASRLLFRDFYVDDFISGANTLEELLAIRDEMIALLYRGGFVIRKWASNHQSALNTIDKRVFDLDCVVREDPVQKTLGVVWDSRKDTLQYSVSRIDLQAASTKRQLLSEISKIFDPLGLLGPVVLFAKVLIQDCWRAKISLPRQFLVPNPTRIELHGFCDACNYGYGACLFLKSVDSSNHVKVRLVCSKSRVAPLSGVTIPRLELCAASVLKKLYVDTKFQFDFLIDQTIFWSDSTIVLAWLKKAPHLLRVFESNKVADIQTLGQQVSWRHVRSEDNPADALSRGQLPSDFLNNSLWTSGPSWLSLPSQEWPQSIETSLTELPGLKKGVCLLTTPSSSFSEIYSRFSDYGRLTRVLAYVLRWRQTSRNQGISTTLYAIHNKFFILNGKNQVRRVILCCVDCIRQKPPTPHAQMGVLPEPRVSESPAFDHTGVDFFGPLLIKEKAHRNNSFLKVYGCVFVCLASKAVHIKLALDLSTQGFLDAFDRFTCRRGLPSHMYSDNGTNFVGANRELQELYDLFNNPEFHKQIGEPIGVNTSNFALVPSKVAKFLELLDTKLCASHSFRRICATLFIDARANIEILKRRGGWTKIVEGYIGDSVTNKRVEQPKRMGRYVET